MKNPSLFPVNENVDRSPLQYVYLTLVENEFTAGFFSFSYMDLKVVNTMPDLFSKRYD